MEDEGADEEEGKVPEMLIQTYLDVNGKDRAKFKPIYNYKPIEKFSKRSTTTNEDKKSNGGNKGDDK